MPKLSCLALVLIVLCLPRAVGAEDWPTYRKDRLRSGVTSEQLKPPLEEVWRLRTLAADSAPKPAYEPMWTPYPDCTWHSLPLIAVGDKVYFSSWQDGRVVCVEAATGKPVWQFIAGGGINRSPCHANGKIYAASDDGHAYCLNAETGELIWKVQAVPAERWLFSFGRPISTWSVKTDVIVDEGVAYFAVGNFPHDGTFVVALNAETGEEIWRNSRISENAWRESMAPAGHVHLTVDQVWIGKDYRGFQGYAYGTPLPFRRDNGTYINGWGNDDREKPKMHTGGMFFPLLGVEHDGVRYFGNSAAKSEHELERREEVWNHNDMNGRWVDADSATGVHMGGRGGVPVNHRFDPDASTVVYAGGIVYHFAYDTDPGKSIATGVYARNAADGKLLWQTDIPERANQLVVANGRLFVGTRHGTIYCFAPSGAAKHGERKETADTAALDNHENRARMAEAAKKMLAESGQTEGYALVLDCGDGLLAYELAKQSELHISAVFRDRQQMEAARAAYTDAGLHLTRIITHLQEEDADELPMPRFFADLIVSEAAANGEGLPPADGDWNRMLKPIRGVALFDAEDQQALESFTAATEQEGWEIDEAGQTATRTRPALHNGGRWSHMWGNAGRTLCSDDSALEAPLGVAWYGPPFVRSGTRHMPLIVNGILVNPDAHALEGYDQYTGRRLWRTEGGNVGVHEEQLAASDKHVYIRYGKVLVQLDLMTGKEIASYNTGFGADHDWGWFAVSDDGEMVFGAAAGGLFGTEMTSGKGNVLWKIGGPDADEKEKIGGRLSMSDGMIYNQGRELEGDERKPVIAEMRAWMKANSPELLDEFEQQVDQRHLVQLTAIDCKTGGIVFRRGVDITNAGGKFLRPVNYGAKRHYNPYIMGEMYSQNGVVLFCSAGRTDKGWGVWNSGGYSHRAMSAYDGKTGDLLWYAFGNYRGRPVIVQETIHAEPWAYDLRTGKRRQRVHPVTGEQADWSWFRANKQCGIFAASNNFLFGRSLGVGYQDLQRDRGLYTFWHSRASCSIDCSSGGGMMIKPPHSLGCKCLWNMPFTIALGTATTEPTAGPEFSQSSQAGESLPVKHLRLDFAATGDRQDEHGNTWMGAARPAESLLMLAFPITLENYEGARADQRSAVFTEVENADVPFVFATSQIGLKSCKFPLQKEGGGTKSYKVRLAFCSLPGDKLGQRVFDVVLNGAKVLEKFDATAEAGGENRAVWKEFSIQAADTLELQLITAANASDVGKLPAISGMEVLRSE